MFFADIAKMTTGGLMGMQRAIRDRLIEEDKLPAEQQKFYGVREHWDWKAQGDEIEAELDARKVTYSRIPW